MTMLWRFSTTIEKSLTITVVEAVLSYEASLVEAIIISKITIYPTSTSRTVVVTEETTEVGATTINNNIVSNNFAEDLLFEAVSLKQSNAS